MKTNITMLAALALGVTCAAAEGDGLLATGEFRIRDPFVLAENGTYYLYEAKPWSGGRGVNAFTSKDLKSWTPKVPVMELPETNACIAVWAPEVHKHNGAFWLFTTLTFSPDPSRPMRKMLQDGYKGAEPQPRGVWVFRSDSPLGPFKPVKEGSVTPAEWMCLDGTLWVEDGKPWMVFCHEWVQTGNGRMMAAPLSEDFSRFTAEPVELFRASDALGGKFVTDGPFLYRSKSGGLRMIWSNLVEGKGYSVIQCRSKTGKVTGPWYMHTPLYTRDGGHGMLFRTFEGQLMLTLHQPNSTPNERMRLYPINETWEGFSRADWNPFGPEWQAQWTPALEREIDERTERCRKADAAVDAAIRAMHLDGLENLKPHQLSGGQQQRTALARILVNGPEVLLLDEPFSALDAHLRFQLEREMLETVRAFGKPVIMVTHDRDEAFRLSDAIAVMRGGAIEVVGPKHAVFSDPETRAGAVLTGCKNISPLRKLGERRVLAVDWGMELTLDRDVGDAKYIGIRMHDIRPGAGENSFRCAVTEEIENPFSYTLMLRPVENADSVPVGWETGKERWEALRAEALDICLPKEYLLLLRE